MDIYLDACALNRLTDDQRQSRIRMEAEAVEEVFRLIWKEEARWVASIALAAEIRRNPSIEKRRDALALLSLAGELLQPNPNSIQRAEMLESLGYDAFDALHLACAEQAKASVLLTTDDRLIRKAMRLLGNPAIQVLNPVNWLREARK